VTEEYDDLADLRSELEASQTALQEAREIYQHNVTSFDRDARAFQSERWRLKYEESLRATARRQLIFRVLLVLFLLTVLGALGLGVGLVVEGLTRNSTGFATLGVVLIVSATLGATVGAWKIEGPLGVSLREAPPPAARSVPPHSPPPEQESQLPSRRGPP
jgi:hypothetical protein